MPGLKGQEQDSLGRVQGQVGADLPGQGAEAWPPPWGGSWWGAGRGQLEMGSPPHASPPPASPHRPPAPRPVLEGPPSARSEEHSPVARTVDGSRQRARGLSWAGRVDGNDLPGPGGGQRPDSAVPLPTTGAARRGLGAWVTGPTPRSQGQLGPCHPLPEAGLLPTGPRQPGGLCLQPQGTLAGQPSGGPNTHLGWSTGPREFEDTRGPRQERRRHRALRTASRVHSKTQTKPAAFCWGGLLFVLGFFFSFSLSGLFPRENAGRATHS